MEVNPTSHSARQSPHQHNNQVPPPFGIQQTSPADSSTTDSLANAPLTTSPPSHTQLQLLQQQYNVPRQLRPMKSPLYVPAALRPTERPTRSTKSTTSNTPSSSSPITPPKSLHGSMESLEDHNQSPHHGPAHADATVVGLAAAAAAYASPDLPGLPPGHDWIVDENLGQVTGEPSKEHWKADAQSPTCDSPACRHTFNVFRRRHHCRHCGHIFCSQHAPNSIPLDQHARFHPDGFPSRACHTCFRHYRRWEEARAKRVTTSDAGDLVGDEDDYSDDIEEEEEEEEGEGEGDGMEKVLNSTTTTRTSRNKSKAGSRRRGPADHRHSRPRTTANRGARGGGGGGGGALISSKQSSETNIGSVPREWAWSTF